MCTARHRGYIPTVVDLLQAFKSQDPEELKISTPAQFFRILSFDPGLWSAARYRCGRPMRIRMRHVRVEMVLRRRLYMVFMEMDPRWPPKRHTAG